MYSFLAIAGLRDAQGVLRRAREVTQTVIPKAGTQLAWTETLLEDMEGGWIASRPDPEPERRLLTSHRDPRVSVLAFGELYEETRQSTAEAIYHAWQDGGEDAACQINGNYSALVVDHEDRAVHLVCDLLGRRRLRFVAVGDALLVSSHDVPLVATGLVQPEFDVVSAASIVAVAWSLGGAGLLSGVGVQDPLQATTWRAGKMVMHDKRRLSLESRIDAKDEQAIAQVLEQMEESMCGSCRAFVKESSGRIHVDLTAGMDSRATFALIWSLAPADRILAQTSGQPQSVDVAVASEIARACNVDHVHSLPEAPRPADFEENCRTFAYFENGSTNAKRATSAPIQYVATDPEIVGGGLSELYRGFYYMKTVRSETLSVDTATELLKRKIFYQKLIREDVCDALLERHAQVVAGLLRLSPNAWDMLDLYYAFERIAHWAGGSRSLWTKCKFMPFGTPRLLRLAYQLPAPVGKRCSIQRKIILDRLPFTYPLGFNGKHSFEDLDQGIRPTRSLMPTMVGRIARRIRRQWLPRSARHKSHDTIRAELFAAELSEQIAGILLAEGSLSAQVFGRPRLEKVIQAHRTGAFDHLHGLGFMVTIETWKKLIEQTAAGTNRWRG